MCVYRYYMYYINIVYLWLSPMTNEGLVGLGNWNSPDAPWLISPSVPSLARCSINFFLSPSFPFEASSYRKLSHFGTEQQRLLLLFFFANFQSCFSTIPGFKSRRGFSAKKYKRRYEFEKILQIPTDEKEIIRGRHSIEHGAKKLKVFRSTPTENVIKYS